jgi:TonB C terminal
MARDPNIPLFLWVAAAIVAHLTWGGGADQVAEVFQERADMRRFAASVQQQLRRRFTSEIALIDDPSDEVAQRDADDEPRAVDGPPDDDSAKKVDPPKIQPPDKPEPDPVPSAERVKKEKVKPEPEKPQTKDKVEPKPEPDKKEAKKAPEVPPEKNQVPQRVAVVQHVQDKQQADNAEAEFLGDDNNRVQEQTQARITATDQDNEKPSPGSQHSGPTEEPGDAHVTDIAQSDDSPGELNRAPSEDKLAAAKKETVSVSQPQGIPEVAGRVQAGPKTSDPGEKGQQAQAPSRTEQAMEQTYATAAGEYQIAKEREERLARAAREARRYRLSSAAGDPDRPLDFLGLGAEGRTELGVNLNLTPGTALAAIGQDQLAREIRADGERRRSSHQGSWKAVGIERWRPAIENYVATVKLGNQTALNTAAAPFATYLNRIHNRLHPIFAVNYLGFLDGLPGTAGMHDKDMKTNLEIVLNQANGSIVKMGVTHTSGVTAFDISALESVQRASPFGAPPPSIVSPDGNVYLHWEFHRNPLFACSTYFARPYIIKVPQKTAPPRVDPPAGPFGPEELPPAKQGSSTRPTPYAAR